jgi:hypothetical protein
LHRIYNRRKTIVKGRSILNYCKKGNAEDLQAVDGGNAGAAMTILC